jgi:hypothetical protein
MSPIAKGESALVHALLQVAPVDVLGQAVGHVVLSLHFDNGQLPSLELLLHPQLSHLNASNSPSSSALRNTSRSTRVCIRLHLYLQTQLSEQALDAHSHCRRLHDTVELRSSDDSAIVSNGWLHVLRQCEPKMTTPPDVDFLVLLHPVESVSDHNATFFRNSW